MVCCPILLRSSSVMTVQGSVLGPLILILFIDDITDCMDISEVNPTSCIIFADDLKICCSYDSIHDNSSIVHTIWNIERWSSLWQLRINPEKSILLQVGSVSPGQSQYVICNQIIQPTIYVRDLSLLYDSKLCFNEYITEIFARSFHRVICCFVLLFPVMFWSPPKLISPTFGPF